MVLGSRPAAVTNNLVKKADYNIKIKEIEKKSPMLNRYYSKTWYVSSRQFYYKVSTSRFSN